jgi:hypothetical protein
VTNEEAREVLKNAIGDARRVGHVGDTLMKHVKTWENAEDWKKWKEYYEVAKEFSKRCNEKFDTLLKAIKGE